MRATESFLRLIWPDAGTKAVVEIRQGTTKHYWFEPHDIAGASIKIKELCDEGTDVYMALGGFEAHERKGEQAVAFKTLWLDLDCGKDKEYPDQASAREALASFLATAQLPDPFIVSSGYGLHIYFPFEAEVTPAEWSLLAKALKTACTAHKFKSDEKCTADAARILRPNATRNYKNGTPRDVRVIAAGTITTPAVIRRALAAFIPASFDAIKAAQVAAAVPTTTSFSELPPVDFDAILPHCATLRYAYECQDEVREPLWYAALGVASFCVDPVVTGIRLSERHPAFSRGDTESKQSQWRAAASGPPTCDTFRSCPGSRCDECAERVTSPVLLGRPRGFVTTTTSVLNNVVRFTDKLLKLDGHGLSVNLPKEGTEHWVRIAAYGVQPMLNVKLLDREGTAVNYIWLETHDDRYVPKYNFLVPAAAVNNSAQFSVECAKHGIINEQETSPLAFRLFTQTMRKWINSLEQQQGQVITFDSFGWMGPDGSHLKDSFLLGNKLYTKDGPRTVPVLPLLREYQDEMVAHGTLEEWTKAVNHYNLPGMEAYMFTFWAGLAAPLMRFTNSKNIVVSLVGNTGVGKSSLQRAIASIYGKYDSKILVDQHDSTLNSVNANLGCLNSLPYIREEAAENDPEEIASWVLTMTQGRERGRLTSSLAKAPVRTWNTVAIVSSNTSIREIVVNTRKDNEARLARTWEIDMALPMPQEEASRLFRPLMTNYGHAGPIFADYIARNLDTVMEAVVTTEDEMSRKFHATGENRFHISFMSAVFVAAKIGMALGLFQHDFKRGRDYAYKQYHSLHQAAQDERQSPEQILAMFIGEIRATTLTVEVDSPASATTVFDSNNNIIHMPNAASEIEARYAADTSAFYVSSLTLRKWYVDNHLNFRNSMNVLQAKGILVSENTKIVLTRGTKLADKRQIRCSCFKLAESDELIGAVEGK